MKVYICDDKKEMGRQAARKASELLNAAMLTKGRAAFVAATGASQFDFLASLVKEKVEWSKTIMFHLDEYIGISENHPASFRKYLKERLIDIVKPGIVNLIEGDVPDPQLECNRLNMIIAREEVDVSFVGIGENGHLAFNDPPADFHAEEPYIVVELNEACRRQQLGEGWFKHLNEVPGKAISMSIKQIMKSRAIICTVPDKRKAEAVSNCLEKEISNLNPASILRNHANVFLYLDRESASLLKNIK